MAESFELLFNRVDNVGMIMAGIDNRNSGGEVNIAIAFDIPKFGV